MRTVERVARRALRQALYREAAGENQLSPLADVIAHQWRELMFEFPDQYAALTESRNLGDPSAWNEETGAERLEQFAILVIQLRLRLREGAKLAAGGTRRRPLPRRIQ